MEEIPGVYLRVEAMGVARNSMIKDPTNSIFEHRSCKPPIVIPALSEVL